MQLHEPPKFDLLILLATLHNKHIYDTQSQVSLSFVELESI